MASCHSFPNWQLVSEMVSGTRSAAFLDRSLAGEDEPGFARAAARTGVATARLSKGLTLRELAARVGMPYSTLSKLENGKMSFTYDKLIRLAQGLGIDLQELMSGARPARGLRPGTAQRHSRRRRTSRGIRELHAFLSGCRPRRKNDDPDPDRHTRDVARRDGRAGPPFGRGIPVRPARGQWSFTRISTRRSRSAPAIAFISTAPWPTPTSGPATSLASSCRFAPGRGIQNIAEAAAKRM